MLQTSEIKTEGTEPFTRQGSLRRVLPSGHNKENLFGRQNEDLNQIYRTFHQEYAIIAEYKMVHSEQVPGVYVTPSKESSLLWFGVIFVRSGMFDKGVFRFNIVLDENFPDSKHPKVIFQSEIFHPVVDTKNELNLLGGFPTWSKTEQHVWQVLKYVHWALHNVNSSAQHAVNPDALNLLRNDEVAFKEKARTCVQISRDRLYDTPPTDDKHYIAFAPYTEEMLEYVRTCIKENKEKVLTFGPSWVKDDLFRPLTRDSMQSESET